LKNKNNQGFTILMLYPIDLVVSSPTSCFSEQISKIENFKAFVSLLKYL